MKIRVIGWTYYSDSDYPDMEITNGKHHAVIDEIRKHQYLFSGFSHEERFGCTPVFNDGSKGSWSQRGWGSLMAEAYEEEGMYAYSAYTYELNNEVYPKDYVDNSLIEDPNSLYEEYEIIIDNEEDFLNLSHISSYKLVKEKVNDKYRYMSIGDTIVFVYNDNKIKKVIADMETDYDFVSEEQRLELMYAHGDDIKKAEEILKTLPIIYKVMFD